MKTEYCATRKELEEHGWLLTSRHAALSTRLLMLIGSDHEAFLDTLGECQTTPGKLPTAASTFKSTGECMGAESASGQYR